MIPIALIVSGLLLALAAALRAARASLVRTPRADALADAASGDRRAGLVAELLSERAGLQQALALAHSALLLMAALPAGWALARLLSGPALFLALAGLALLLVLVGDVLPRQAGEARPRRLAYRLAPLMAHTFRLGRRATELAEEEHDEPAEEEEEDREERELISSVIEFSDAIVREVMLPRTDMITVERSADTAQALEVVIGHGFSRIPVRGAGPDDIVGIVYAKDLLRLLDSGEEPKPVEEVMRRPYFVPETKRVADLLREMQANQVHMAVVVDEFGGTAGLVTIEDLLEELVGEIADEYDTEEPLAVEESDGTYLVDARMAVDELERLLGLHLPAGDWDTVGGLVLGLAGRVPNEGESFELEDAVLTPYRVQGRRVAQVRVSQR